MKVIEWLQAGLDVNDVYFCSYILRIFVYALSALLFIYDIKIGLHVCFSKI